MDAMHNCILLQAMHCLLFAAVCSCTQPHGNSTKGKGALAYVAKLFQLVSSHIRQVQVWSVYNQQHKWTDYKIYCDCQEHSIKYGWLLRYCTVDLCKAVQNRFG